MSLLLSAARLCVSYRLISILANSHIGGFAMGTLLAIIFYPVIHQTRKHRITFYVLRAIALPGEYTSSHSFTRADSDNV